MRRTIISYFIITLLLFMTVAPCFGHKYFNAYAEETSEQLTDDEKLEAGLSVYLNSRNGYITGSVDAVKALMLSLIHTKEFWENTTVGSIAEVYAGIIIKYSPFRVSLKGSAVRAFNDLYNYLKDNDKIPNAADSDGGETTDNLYDGFISSGNLFYVAEINNIPGNTNIAYGFKISDVKTGSRINGIDGDNLLSQYLSANNISVETFNDQDKTDSSFSPALQNISITINYFSDVSRTMSIGRAWMGFSDANYSPQLRNTSMSISVNNQTNLSNSYFNNTPLCAYLDRAKTFRGNPALICLIYNNVNYNYVGWATYNYTNSVITLTGLQKIERNDILPTRVNLDTDDFQKQDPPVPEGDEEVEYTPKDKDTGNTYNTYNEYINNYVNKRTVINKEEVTPPPGGTVPDWGDSGSGSGTITPGEGNTYNFNLPDFELPDLNIDWNISGLGEKFPFSIPFDLIAFFTVLNAEPETPAVQGQIDLKIVQWDIDWDLSQFDSLARILRNLEFIGFCIALILITRRIIKG